MNEAGRAVENCKELTSEATEGLDRLFHICCAPTAMKPNRFPCSFRFAFQGLYFLGILFLSAPLYSQVISIADADLEACSGQFYDDGLDVGPYADQNHIITICPDTPGEVVSVSFSSFDLQTNPNPNNNDFLLVYDGASTNAPLVGQAFGNSLEGVTITAFETNLTGCLTFQLVVQNGATGGNAGWEAEVNCALPCGVVTSALDVMAPTPDVNTPNTVTICPGGEVMVDGSNSVGAPGGLPLESWIWNWGDGTSESNPTPEASHTFQEAGEYFITLYVEDENGCTSVNLSPVQVLVSPVPNFDINFEPTICVDVPTVMDATGFTTGSWTSILPPQVAEEEFLTDSLFGIPQTSPLVLDYFPSGSEVTSCTDVLSISLNMYHTFIGDLTVYVECPNGQQLLLFENGASGAPDPSGCLYPDLGGNNLGNPAAMEPYEYTWTETAEWIIDDPDNPYYDGNAFADVPAGEYAPCGSFCDLIGCPLNGEWQLVYVDNWLSDEGYVEGWSMEFDPDLLPDVTVIEPSIGLGVDSSYWDVAIGTDGVVAVDEAADIVDLEFDVPGLYEFDFAVINSFGCAFDTTIAIEVVDGPEGCSRQGPTKYSVRIRWCCKGT